MSTVKHSALSAGTPIILLDINPKRDAVMGDAVNYVDPSKAIFSAWVLCGNKFPASY
jgi:hypothetical protein